MATVGVKGLTQSTCSVGRLCFIAFFSSFRAYSAYTVSRSKYELNLWSGDNNGKHRGECEAYDDCRLCGGERVLRAWQGGLRQQRPWCASAARVPSQTGVLQVSWPLVLAGRGQSFLRVWGISFSLSIFRTNNIVTACLVEIFGRLTVSNIIHPSEAEIRPAYLAFRRAIDIGTYSQRSKQIVARKKEESTMCIFLIATLGGHILETSQENLRKISYLRTIFDNVWENANQTISVLTNSRFNNSVT